MILSAPKSIDHPLITSFCPVETLRCSRINNYNMGVCMSIDEETLQITCGSPKHMGEKKKMMMDMLNAEVRIAQMLSKTPGRLCDNGPTSSACVFTKQGHKGVNQDCMLVWEEFRSQAKTVFCGIFDGHGPSGHLVARKVRDSLPMLLVLPANMLRNEVPETNGDSSDGDYIYKSQENNSANKTGNTSCHEPMALPALWKDSFVAAYKLMDKNLKTHPQLCCFDSGTTALTMIIQENDLMIGNVGDSRAVLARRAHDGSLVAHQLTNDLKPNLPKELERIKRCKGCVFALEDEPDVARVWVPHSNMPGLAMARALGDFYLKDYGLSATPQVFHRKLIKEDEFIVLASDGVWDVLSNEEVVRIVASAYPKEGAAKALIHAAVWTWKIKHGTWRTDDCTAVCYFIKEQLIPTSPIEHMHINRGLS